MSPSDFREKFDLRSKSRSIASRHIAPTWLQVVDYFNDIEKEVRQGSGMADHLAVVREYVDRYERVTSFFQFGGSNIGSLTSEERECVAPIVARLAESQDRWANVERALGTVQKESPEI